MEYRAISEHQGLIDAGLALQAEVERRASEYETDADFIEATLYNGLNDCEALAEIIAKFMRDPTVGNASELAGAVRGRIQSEAFDQAEEDLA